MSRPLTKLISEDEVLLSSYVGLRPQMATTIERCRLSPQTKSNLEEEFNFLVSREQFSNRYFFDNVPQWVSYLTLGAKAKAVTGREGKEIFSHDSLKNRSVLLDMAAITPTNLSPSRVGYFVTDAPVAVKLRFLTVLKCLASPLPSGLSGVASFEPFGDFLSSKGQKSGRRGPDIPGILQIAAIAAIPIPILTKEAHKLSWVGMHSEIFDGDFKPLQFDVAVNGVSRTLVLR